MSELDNACSERARSALGVALSFALRRHRLPEEWLRQPLLEARRGEHLATFETREALLAHARALAAPEGRLYLRLTGSESPRREALADNLAVAIQLTTWLARLAPEFEQGRLHLPIDALVAARLDLQRLFLGTSRQALSPVIAAEIAQVRALYARGWDLCAELGPWLGRRLAFVLRWHAATLGALESAQFAVHAGPPPAGVLRLLACAATSLATTRPPKWM